MFDLADQRAALLGKHSRRVLELGALGPYLRHACLDGFDLRRRACSAALPIVALGEDRLQATVGEFRFVGERLGLGAYLGGKAQMTLDIGAHRGKSRFSLGGGRKFRKRRGCGLMRVVGFSQVGVETVVRL